MMIFTVNNNGEQLEIEVIGAEGIAKMRELVHRATNLWPDAPPEIKEFADKVIHGRVAQNYYEQDTSRRKAEFYHYHQCSCGHVTPVSTICKELPEYSVTCEGEIEITDIEKETQQLIIRKIPCKRLEPFHSYSR